MQETLSPKNQEGSCEDWQELPVAVQGARNLGLKDKSKRSEGTWEGVGQKPKKMGGDLFLKQVRNSGRYIPHFMISCYSTSFSLSAPILLGLQEIQS